MNRWIVSAGVFTAAAAVLAASGGCVGGDIDFYAEVIADCDYRTAETIWRDDPTQSSLTPECKEALMQYLPFDETWENAPAGLQDKVLESFQVILAYPLALPPENRILGQVPWVIHARQLCVLAPELFEDCPGEHGGPEELNMARNAFNYLLSRFDNITYEPVDDTTTHSASLTPEFSKEHGPGYLLSITDYFWSSNSDYSMTPFRRASVLMHESWHGDSRSHTLCPSDSDVAGFKCDADTAGPYMYETVYLATLLHGSALLEKPGRLGAQYLISNVDITYIGLDMCLNLQYRIKPLKSLVEDTPSCWSVTRDWVLSREGIDRR